jgi:hypothetical protein
VEFKSHEIPLEAISKDMTVTFLFMPQMKFWAKTHDVNCPKDQTMSSMAIISLVAFHLQVKWGCTLVSLLVKLYGQE